MGQRLYFCTFTQIPPRGTTAVTACRQHGRPGQGWAQLCAASRHSRGPVHSRAARVPPRSLRVGAVGHGGPPSKAGVLHPPARGCVLARVPSVSWPLGPLVWL